ncbi:unnamed protein product [Mytilus edulis]|uniref:Uncharacterized protein n=1 Tax=Mytilus edulis TaxID=6550 RepID=A0A8S3QAR6_MYTED|nr:unnamed protein product [Mytilus edulis]
MDSEIESMCKRMTTDRIKRLLSVLQSEESEIISDEVVEQNQNKEKMASFSEVVTNHQPNLNVTSQNTDNDPGNFGCDIQSLFRECLRINGKVTACQTGDRVVISKVLDKVVPRNLQIGKYMARVFHAGQPEFNRSINYDTSSNVKKCHKCLKPDCQSDLLTENENSENLDVNVQESESEVVQSNDNQTIEHMSETADIQTPNTAILKPSHTSSTSNKASSTKTGPARNVQMSNVNNTGQDKSQPSIDKFVNTPKMSRKSAARNHTPPTPTENIGPKKSKIINPF